MAPSKSGKSQMAVSLLALLPYLSGSFICCFCLSLRAYPYEMSLYLILSLGSETPKNSKNHAFFTFYGTSQGPEECHVQSGLLIKDRLFNLLLQNFKIHHPLPHLKLPSIRVMLTHQVLSPSKHPTGDTDSSGLTSPWSGSLITSLQLPSSNHLT